MNSLRVIVYNVPQGEELVAIRMAAQVYQQRYDEEPSSVSLAVDHRLVLSDVIFSVDELQLQLDSVTAPGTVQVGR